MNMKKTTLDLTNEKFGDLMVLSLSRYYRKVAYWNCICSCGNEIEVTQKDLFSGIINNCGCKNASFKKDSIRMIPKPRSNSATGITGVCFDKKDNRWKVTITYKKITYFISAYDKFEYAVNARLKAEEIIKHVKKEDLKNNPPQPKPPKKPTKDLVGKKFGKLTVEYLKKVDKYHVWHCKCECGNEKDFYQENLLSGSSTSCGCEKKKKAKKLYDENLHMYKGIQIEKAVAKTTQRNNTTGFRGVMIDKKTGKYRVRMILQGVRHELGYYSDFEEAKKARIVAEEKRDAIVDEYFNMVNK